MPRAEEVQERCQAAGSVWKTHVSLSQRLPIVPYVTATGERLNPQPFCSLSN